MRDAFENVKGQIGSCGIWCGSCAVGNGSLRELTERLEAVLDSHGAQHWAPAEMNYPAFSSGLDAIAGAASCVGCRQGGGRDDCSLRVCSAERDAADCSDCVDFAVCPNSELLGHMRKGARRADMFVRDPRQGFAGLLPAWIERLKKTWPSTILFTEYE